MKKILTILLVAILAASTLFAVDFSGRFKAGYKFTFKDEFKGEGVNQNVEGRLNIKVSDDEKIWTISFKGAKDANTAFTLDSDDKIKANLSLDLTKLLAANGVEVGEWSVKGSIGANSKMTALSAYNDKTDDELFKLKNDGKYSTELAIGYGDIIKTKIQGDPISNGKGSILLSALTEPVKGISVAAAYGYNAYIYTTNTAMNAEGKNEGSVKHGVSVSADVNVGELADLDFTLGLAVYDNMGFGATVGPENINTFAAILYGGVDVVDGFFELRMDNELIEKGATTLGMKTKVNINVVEGLGLDVYFNIGNFGKFDTTYAVGGDVSYTISGVKLAANLEYAAGAGFSVKPTVTVNF